MINVKKLNIGNKTSTITFEHESTEKSCRPDKELKAIYCLLGGYNEFGRHIDIDKFSEIRDKFLDAIYDVKKLME